MQIDRLYFFLDLVEDEIWSGKSVGLVEDKRDKSGTEIG